MENSLYDELLQEIFQKLPPSSSCSVSLVCKRWLNLYRFSRTSLSLNIKTTSQFSLIIPFLSHHPFLSSLSITLSLPSPLSPRILSLISLSCSNLMSLSLLPPLSLSSILSLSTSFPRLNSLCITLPRPIILNWVTSFPCLKDLSITFCDENEGAVDGEEGIDDDDDEEEELGLELESLYLMGISGNDWGIDWLWKRCKKLKKLRLQSCQGIGGSCSSFIKCLKCLKEIEVKTCRSVVYVILLELVKNCESLSSVLVHDGGSKEGLLQFFTQCRSQVRKLDLRLPLDLSNEHLLAMTVNFTKITSLKLQSCFLGSGEGLKALAGNVGEMEELALVNCDVVEREPGLLATLGQSLRNLRKLDLSDNEMLLDKEFVLMVASCAHLIELKVRSCKGLTSVAVVSMGKSCKKLESVDIMECFGIHSEDVEMFVKNCSRLRRIEVEESKLSDAAKMWASSKFIEVVQ